MANELPPLPEPKGEAWKGWYFTADQMRDYARAAVLAERERCAAWVDARRSAFCEEHGSIDPDTGALEFGRGAHAEAKAEYVGELEEIAAGLRALGPNAYLSGRTRSA